MHIAKFVTDTAYANQFHNHPHLLPKPAFKGKHVDLMMTVEKVVNVFLCARLVII